MICNHILCIILLTIIYIFPDDTGSGVTTALIRVFAALGLSNNLKTMTSDACKIGLSRSVDTGSPLIDCLTDAGNKSMEQLPNNHYLNKEKYF